MSWITIQEAVLLREDEITLAIVGQVSITVRPLDLRLLGEWLALSLTVRDRGPRLYGVGRIVLVE
jgi:hypothetical protein